MALVTRRGVTWNVIEPRSAHHFWSGWEADAWEPKTLDTIDRFVTAGSTFVDIGAWIGPTSLWAARLGAHVVAIEPDRVALYHLRWNSDHNAEGRITVVPGAVTDHTGTCRLASQRDYGWGSSMSYVADEGYVVPCWTLPDLFDSLSLENVSLVKMDIEGGEAKILDVVCPFLAEHKIPLLLEMHHELRFFPLSFGWWLSNFSHIEGKPTSYGHLLCLP